jgi:hypothetical protein
MGFVVTSVSVPAIHKNSKRIERIERIGDLPNQTQDNILNVSEHQLTKLCKSNVDAKRFLVK